MFPTRLTIGAASMRIGEALLSFERMDRSVLRVTSHRASWQAHARQKRKIVIHEEAARYNPNLWTVSG
jgi:hypothetical protein